MEIYPGVYQIHQMFVNLYLVIGPDGLLLVDTGLGGSRGRVLSAIQEAGKTPADLKTIVITHADGDHFGGLNDLQRITQASAWASPVEAEAIRRGTSSRQLTPAGLQRMLFRLVAPLIKSRPARIDATLAEGQSFNVLGGLQALATPGHTPGHTSLFSPSTGVLFAGDSIQVIAGVPQPSGAGNTWNIQKAQESFERQIALKPALILAGHGVWKAG
jgi:glyoxylase-like metal-dependent hydrolase (beta-lactamase superfamily II)